MKIDFLKQQFKKSYGFPVPIKEAFDSTDPNHGPFMPGFTTYDLALRGYESIFFIWWLQITVPGIDEKLCRFTNKRSEIRNVKGWKYLNSPLLGMIMIMRLTMGVYYYANLNDYWSKDKNIALGLITGVMKQPLYTTLAKNICQYDVEKEHKMSEPKDTIYKVCLSLSMRKYWFY